MRYFIDVLVIAMIGIGVVAFFGYQFWPKKKALVPNKCKHRQWTPWKMIKEVPVYLYSELDEGKGLPDRVDSQMERECGACHIRQVQTVRGIDSQHYK